MSLAFPRARPLQAGKFVAIVGVVLYAVAGYYRLVPGGQLAAFFLVVGAGLVLAVVVAVEALYAGYRVVSSERSVSDRLGDRPGYAIVRAGEAVVAVLAAVVFVATFVALTDEPMAGPGAVGLLLFGVGLGLAILGASFIRTVTEYAVYRRSVA